MAFPSGAWRPKNKVQIEKKNHISENCETIKPYIFSPLDVIPPSSHHPQLGIRGPRVSFESDKPQQRTTKGQYLVNKGRTLDGFLLLHGSNVDLPEESTHAVVAGLNITTVVLEDMEYFPNLQYLDISENQVSVESLQTLRSIVELKLQCNSLDYISSMDQFVFLEILDLSFNYLTEDVLPVLMNIPKLKELYLSHNSIKSLPSNMEKFQQLVSLSFERNFLQGEEAILCLSSVPRLRELNLSFNKFTMIPESAIGDKSLKPIRFLNLEMLDLAFNDIKSEDEICCLGRLEKLKKLVLYGNPIASKATINQDVKVFDHFSTFCCKEDMEIVLFPPDVKKSKVSFYRDFGITKVKEKSTSFISCPKTTLESKQNAGSLEKDFMNGIRSPLVSKFNEEKYDQDNTFLTGVGIIQEDDEQWNEEQMTSVSLNGESTSNPISSAFVRQSFSKDSSNLNSGNINVKSAMNALRYALNHPLSSHTDVEDINPLDRLTYLQKIRQIPKRPYIQKSKLAYNTGKACMEKLSSQMHAKKDCQDQNQNDTDDKLLALTKTARMVANTYRPSIQR